jgi:hypothetical protein
VKKKTTNRVANAGTAWFSVERVFLVGSIIAYIVPIAIYIFIDLSIIQLVMLFFGSHMFLFVGLMLYGVFAKLFSKTRVV